jgi:hypothetical protein
LGASHAAPWVNALFYERARQTSVANAAFLQHVSQQLKVPHTTARAIVEQLIDGKLVDVLGGDYAAAEYRDGATLWQSDAWDPAGDGMPRDYQSPLLKWFRGLDADFTKTEGRVMLRAQLDMQRTKPEMNLELPSFNLPNVFGDFGKVSPKPKSDQPPQPEELPAPKNEPTPPKAKEF